MMDLAGSLFVFTVIACAAFSYAWRLATLGRFRSARVDREGTSVLLGTPAMEMVHWVLDPIGDACVAIGVSANAVTWSALVFGLGAGVSLGLGHFGVAALLTACAGLGDALDGVVARKSACASDAGELLDASVDRYVEFAFLAGLAFHLRHQGPALLLALGALAGSFMVSYATAKAEALHVIAPRGAMRRSERVAYLLGAVALEPLVAVLPAMSEYREFPTLAALALVAVVGNASAIRRLGAVAHALNAPTDSGPATSRDPQPDFAADLARHQAGAFMATVVDFGMMILLVEAGTLGPMGATAAGAACGALTNFSLSKDWVFPGSNRGDARMSARYAAVSAGSLALNTTGEALANGVLGAPYLPARLLVSAIVSVAYNFPLHRRFVFRTPRTP
jgi:CDP-diacylglycerol--glycerol-3-phosphate 3-phosphatidyltransferase